LPCSVPPPNSTEFTDLIASSISFYFKGGAIHASNT